MIAAPVLTIRGTQDRNAPYGGGLDSFSPQRFDALVAPVRTVPGKSRSMSGALSATNRLWSTPSETCSPGDSVA